MNKNKKNFLFYGHQTLDKKDYKWVEKALKSDWLTTGPFVEKFEKELTRITQAKYAVVCSSGTSALILAYMSLFGINSKKKVLIPSMTFIGTANAAKLLGMEVDFVDCYPENGLIDLNHLEKKIRNGNYDLIVPVHMNGQPAEMEKIFKIAKKYNLNVIDDASHAIGSSYRSKFNKIYKVGSCKHSDITTFSFHPVKNITMGEGGAITTNNYSVFRKIVSLRSHGINRGIQKFKNKELALSKKGDVNPWYYEVDEIGFNFRISDINCALGISQIEKLNVFKKKRLNLIKCYEKFLKPLKGIVELISNSKKKM